MFDHFTKARLKLTTWYLLIIMIISIAFSVFIYIGANREFDRILRLQRYRLENPNLQVRIFPEFPWQDDIVPLPKNHPEPEVMQEARLRVVVDLIGINIIILIISSLAGYFLAGRTLKPIKNMVDEQNRFITDASHELRTPITSLRTEIEVGLRNKAMDASTAKKLLESNLEEVIALQSLSDSLLELAQNGHEIAIEDLKQSSLLEIINAAVKKVEPMALKKQITIDKKIKDEKVLAVSDRLQEVFVILIDNAIKYSMKKGKVLIESKKMQNQVIISIADNGVGIAKEDIPHIFDRFYRANKSRSKTEAPGYGLGLAIAKKIIESHGGQISVVSVLGKKTTFSINIPCV